MVAVRSVFSAFPVRRWLALGAAAVLGAAAPGWSQTPGDSAPTAPRLEERGHPAIRTYLPSDYKGHNQIWAIAEGRTGLMYFGAHSEVLEFDGITWRHVPVPGAAFVRGLQIDDAGTLWVGGVNEFGFIRAEGSGPLQFESLRPHLPADIEQIGDIRTIHVMPDGVYFQTDAYLLRWNNGRLDRWDMHEQVVSLAVRWGERLIVCRGERWMMPTPDGGWANVDWEPEPVGRILLSQLIPDGNDGWWGAATRDGLMHFDGEDVRFITTDVGEHIRLARLSGLNRMPDGRLLFTSYGRGLLVTDPALQPLLHLHAENGLSTNTVICSAVTRRSVVWLGTENGIVRLDFASGVTRHTARSGLDRNGVDHVARINGEVVFATNNGPFRLLAGEGPVDNPRFERWAAVEDNLNVFYPVDDGVLIGGLQGLWWIHEGTVHDLESPSNVRYLFQHSHFPDHLFGLHLTGLAIWRREGDSWAFDHLVDAPRGELQSLSEDAAGNLWVGTNNNGFWRLPYGEITLPDDPTAPLPDPRPVHYDADDGIPTHRNRTVVETLDGAPLFMTGDGFFRYDPSTDSFSPESAYGEAFANGTWTAHYMARAVDGGAWFEVRTPRPDTPNSAQVIGKSINGELYPLPLPYLSEIGALDALVSEQVGDEEILWVCGRNGLLRVNVTRYRDSQPPGVGATLLYSVTTSGGKALASHRDYTGASAAPLQIQAGDNSVRFRFGTVALAGEPDALQTSQLLGFVDGGEEETNDGERTFTNLPPGHYVFEARGRTSDYRWSEPARLEFEVLAPWWLTRTSLATYVLIVFALVYLIVRWRTRRLEFQRQSLEAVVAARTVELANKARELERLHKLEHDQTLAARLAAETARLELLRYQLNPHFLFNSLNSIRALVYTAPETAGEMVTKLAEFCRRTLNRGNDEMVTVENELEMVRNYLEIEQVRWQDGLQVTFSVTGGAEACELPQNLLLPLLENAIKYGGRTSPGTLEITVTITLRENRLTCAVANTGTWVEPSENPFTDSTRVGLTNLRQRLLRHYGEDASVIQSSTPGWVTVTVTLPRCR